MHRSLHRKICSHTGRLRKIEMKGKSIRSKMLISIIGITLLTAFAMAGVFYRKAADMIEQNYVTILQQRMDLMCETIDDMLKNICNININASCDDEIKQGIEAYLGDGNEERLNEISSRMRAFCKREDAIHSMYLLIPEKDQIVTTLDYPVYRTEQEKEKLQRFVQAVKEDSGPVIVEDLVHEGEKLLVFVEKIKDTQGNLIAYLCANIEERKLSYEYFAQPENEDISKICLIREGSVIASGSLSQMGKAFDKDGAYQTWIDMGKAAGADKENIYVYCEGNFSGCGIFAQVKRNVILSDLQDMRTYIAGIAAVLGVLALAAAVYLTRIVYRPIQKLTIAMQQVSEGEINTRAEVVSRDEIGMAAEEFNRMLDRIGELIVRLIEEEQMKKDAELEALQYQITPHFMYNTLNSVKCYAMICGQKQIAGVIEDFVELLQTCISKKGTFLTVAEEMQVLRNYIRLQEFRNGEAFQVRYEASPEAEQCLIPRLILQPLVENAILHGMDLKRGQSHLLIRAETKDGILHLEVKDNGRGMSEEQIRELLTKKVKKTKGLTAVGIPNVRDRLKLYYGEQAELSYESTGEGTTAKIYLPEIRNGEMGNKK